MTYQWLIDKLKIDGQGTKREVLETLKGATIEEIRELSIDLNSIFILMNAFGLEDYQEFLMATDKRGNKNGN